MTDLKQLLERLLRKEQRFPVQGGGSLSTDGKVTSYITDDGKRLVNPDGPEAAQAILTLSEENRRVAAVEADAVSGLRYIEQRYGRLDGVGWDRVFDAHDELVRAALHAEGSPKVFHKGTPPMTNTDQKAREMLPCATAQAIQTEAATARTIPRPLRKCVMAEVPDPPIPDRFDAEKWAYGLLNDVEKIQPRSFNATADAINAKIAELEAALTTAHQAGIAEAESRIVAWLRDGVPRSEPVMDPEWTRVFNAGIDHCAKSIESGDHLKENSRG